jgi:hypothetical protein
MRRSERPRPRLDAATIISIQCQFQTHGASRNVRAATSSTADYLHIPDEPQRDELSGCVTEVLIKMAPVVVQEHLWNRMVSMPSVMPSTADI